MAAPDTSPESDGERVRRQVARCVGTSIDDRDLGTLVRLLEAVEAHGSGQTLGAAGDELIHLGRQFRQAGDDWMCGYLAACQARVSAARARRHLVEAGMDAAVAQIHEAIDGGVLVALARAGELTLAELSEQAAYDIPAVAASVARWQRRGRVAVETAADGTVTARFEVG